MKYSAPDWTKLEQLADQLAQPGIQAGTIAETEWRIIEEALQVLSNNQNWEDILRLRNLFTAMYARDSMTGLTILQQLDSQAIAAGRQTKNKLELGHLLGAKGHNLHRQGYHREAIEAFDESAKDYLEMGEDFPAIKSYYMTSLCYRALGDKEKAKEIVAEVLDRTDPQDAWRGNPLQVMAWLLQDEGRLADAENLLWQALELQKVTEDPDMLVAGTLADLAEIVGISGRSAEAKHLFEESLSIMDKHQGKYERQEARTLLKYSELLMHQKNYGSALIMLNQADSKVSSYGHYYDLLWQIELAKSFIYLRNKEIFKCLQKLRSTFRLRRILGLSNPLLVQYVIRRYAQRLLPAKRL
jgi:tetratricopeptide (TPR) repeat protein